MTRASGVRVDCPDMTDTLAQLIAGTTPVVIDETRGFWEGTLAEELRAQQCAACGVLQFPGGPCCATCLSSDVTWRAVSGRGTVFSFTIVRHAFHPTFAPLVPYVVADIALDEGPIMTSMITDVDHAAVRIGMPVRVWFDEPIADPFGIPLRLAKFKPEA